jgi:hypothetical protein
MRIGWPFMSTTPGPNLNPQAAQVRAHFDAMLATLRDPDGYGVWFVPVVAGRAPRADEAGS